MGCGSTKLTLHKYNGILTCNHLLYSNIKVNIEKFRDQQKINSYSLFFVDSKCCSPARRIKFEYKQILLVDLSTYYSKFNTKVWKIKLIVDGKNNIKILLHSCNTIINKNRIINLNIE